jgi:YhcH/YjgK/YiaL family protein
MIVDYLDNIKKYAVLSPNLATGIQFMLENNLNELAVGKYEIDGENVFAIVQSYDTKPLSEGKWEAHQKYIDIQHVISGNEKMGFAPLKTMEISQPYDNEKDYLLFSGDGHFLDANSDNFFVFYPQDVHLPGLHALSGTEPVKKIVVKVKI